MADLYMYFVHDPAQNDGDEPVGGSYMFLADAREHAQSVQGWIEEVAYIIDECLIVEDYRQDPSEDEDEDEDD